MVEQCDANAKRNPRQDDFLRELAQDGVPSALQADGRPWALNGSAPIQMLSDYQLYLAMIEPQKKLRFFKASSHICPIFFLFAADGVCC